jgi:hypothetical protein
VLESTNPSAQLRTSQVVSDVAHMADRLILQSGDPYFSRADPDLSTDPPGVADLATPQPLLIQGCKIISSSRSNYFLV